ncbi:MAG: thiamine-phosphate kinase [Planctomycetota bacterium]|nr:thiamine-phosphate kinase [Planctomycetota bacterium]
MRGRVAMRERDFIAHLLATQAAAGESIELDAGDDMAVVRAPECRVLAAIDAVVEGRHFRVGTDPFLIGRKAVLRNVSDVAAMAARPLACLASATLPADCPESVAERLLAGLRDAADRHGCPLVGGDTSVHDRPDAPLVVSVAILATPALPGGRVVTRRGSRIGDHVAVTGVLGGSLDPDGGGRHLEFEPRVDAAIELGTRLGDDLHAMIDLSDGLGIDAGHLLVARRGEPESSNLAIEIDAANLPCAPGLDWRRAIGDGEDFELLFTAASPPPESAGGVSIRRIGEVVERGQGPAVRLRVGGGIVDITRSGFEHGVVRSAAAEVGADREEHA